MLLVLFHYNEIGKGTIFSVLLDNCFSEALHQLISVWTEFTKYSGDSETGFPDFPSTLEHGQLQETSDSAA